MSVRSSCARGNLRDESLQPRPHPLITLQHITRRYSAAVAALDDVSLEIGAGEFVAITGPSGCGKSTLMHLIGGLDTPTTGEITVAGLALHTATEAQLTAYRREKLGIVFQFFNLLPTMSVLENVCLPLLLRGEPLAQARAKASAMLELVDLTDRLTHGMHQLSGGSPTNRRATSIPPMPRRSWSCCKRFLLSAGRRC